ncbi:hypothetical protein, partial [Allokutzneria sp. NRRL B-24872]|uniref:hypothetical protein n=1 Tax=Allokutzneria sp. NRRL B-24872 TaxID=1137961 RepID=UPI00143D4A78
PARRPAQQPGPVVGRAPVAPPAARPLPNVGDGASPAERQLREKIGPLSTFKPEKLQNGPSGTYVAPLGKDRHVVYRTLESQPGVEWGDSLAVRDIAAYRVAEELGWSDLVVVATEWADGFFGRGSAQPMLPGASLGSPDLAAYQMYDRQRVAVFDYVIGALNRGPGTYVDDAQNRLVLVSNGESLPTASELASGAAIISSQFVVDALHSQVPFAEGVLNAVRGVDPARLAARLHAAGITDPQVVAGAIARLQEIQRHGRITGQAWGRPIG